MRWILVITLLACEALAVGTIDVLKGEPVVQRERAGAWLIAKDGDQLKVSDVIKTDRGSAARLKFDDGTIITLGASTTFEIEAFVNAGDKNAQAKFKVDNGIFKVVTGAIGKVAPENFTLKTRTATMGIRGTTFYGLVGGSADSYACTSGSISVKGASGGAVIVASGEMTTVGENGGAPSKPTAVNMRLFESVDGYYDPLFFAAVIAVIIGALAVIGAVWFLFFRKRKKRRRK